LVPNSVTVVIVVVNGEHSRVILLVGAHSVQQDSSLNSSGSIALYLDQLNDVILNHNYKSERLYYKDEEQLEKTYRFEGVRVRSSLDDSHTILVGVLLRELFYQVFEFF